MIGFSYWQLKGMAPQGIQKKDAKLAATFNIGGALCASVCTVLRHAS
jgi:acetyl-CoA C-acetyltransferase